jgi:cellulose biosynthesis protein BcsQ
VTLYDVRRRQDRDCEAAIREYFPQTFEDVIKRNSKTSEATGAGMDIFEYDPKNPVATAYMNIAKKIDQK